MSSESPLPPPLKKIPFRQMEALQTLRIIITRYNFLVFAYFIYFTYFISLYVIVTTELTPR